jgi:dipeptidyl-peptidase-4
MINNTDSVYSRIIPVQYPKVGEDPSSAKVGSIDLATQKITWMRIPGDPKQNYLPRMQWVGDQLLVQQLNRKQDELKVYICDPSSGDCKLSYSEKDDAWVDIMNLDLTANWSMYDMKIVGNSFLRVTEKDGWRHLYKVKMDGSEEKNLTDFEGDMARFYNFDEKGKNLYINASPENPTQRYLYQTAANGKGKLKRITPEEYTGVNTYNISPNSKYAIHTYSNANTPGTTYLVRLPSHEIITTLVDNQRFKKSVAALNLPKVELFKVTTSEGVEMDGRLIKPVGFEPNKKYPVIYFTYGGPGGMESDDSWKYRGMYHFMLAQKGYVIIVMDGRGTPSLKGRDWRKAIFKQVGVLNTRDFALAVEETLKWNFIDPERTAYWGWSAGGKMALNLIFRYPDVIKTAISVAAVSNGLLYDNVYTERYMGLKSENLENYRQASALSQAKNLEGNLLIIHGTGDDNVHYQNAELLMNELIKHNKQFRVMPYPNRSHGIYEGENTTRHLYTLMTNYFLEMNPLGAK